VKHVSKFQKICFTQTEGSGGETNPNKPVRGVAVLPAGTLNFGKSRKKDKHKDKDKDVEKRSSGGEIKSK
jgi:hypothetical protein